MIWTGWTDFPHEPRTSDMRPMGEGRPAGLHLSQIIHRMKVGAGESVGDVQGDQPGVRLQEGFLWESVVEYMIAGLPRDEALELAFKRYLTALRTSVTQQVQLVKDDIHMTPDAFNPEAGETESYKTTRKSWNYAKTLDGFAEKCWTWFVQEKGYCYALGVDTVRFVVWWVAGDYSRGPGSGPRMLETRVTFTPEELVDNWRVVLSHAAALKAAQGVFASPEKLEER